MAIERIHHVQIAAPPGSEDQARAFFAGILGLREIEKPENLRKRGGAWFAGEGLEIHVGIEDPFQPARKAHVALQVTDLRTLRLRLEEHSIRTWADEPLPGFKRFYAEDPFGNRMEFLEIAPPRRNLRAAEAGHSGQQDTSEHIEEILSREIT